LLYLFADLKRKHRAAPTCFWPDCSKASFCLNLCAEAQGKVRCHSTPNIVRGFYSPPTSSYEQQLRGRVLLPRHSQLAPVMEEKVITTIPALAWGRVAFLMEATAVARVSTQTGARVPALPRTRAKHQHEVRRCISSARGIRHK
jgi:hypothetical protein